MYYDFYFKEDILPFYRISPKANSNQYNSIFMELHGNKSCSQLISARTPGEMSPYGSQFVFSCESIKHKNYLNQSRDTVMVGSCTENIHIQWGDVGRLLMGVPHSSGKVLNI